MWCHELNCTDSGNVSVVLRVAPLYSFFAAFSNGKRSEYAVPAAVQLPKLLELVGLGYSAWFTYRYLLFKVFFAAAGTAFYLAILLLSLLQ